MTPTASATRSPSGSPTRRGDDRCALAPIGRSRLAPRAPAARRFLLLTRACRIASSSPLLLALLGRRALAAAAACAFGALAHGRAAVTGGSTTGRGTVPSKAPRSQPAEAPGRGTPRWSAARPQAAAGVERRAPRVEAARLCRPAVVSQWGELGVDAPRGWSSPQVSGRSRGSGSGPATASKLQFDLGPAQPVAGEDHAVQGHRGRRRFRRCRPRRR